MFERSVTIRAPIASVFAYHERPGALERLTPPWEKMRVLERQGGIHDRGFVKARLPPGILYHAQHTDYDPPFLFRDHQVRGPFKHWDHKHIFQALDAEHTRLTDSINYAPPVAPISGGLVRARIERMFKYRHTITAIDNERIAWAAPFGKKRIAISGMTGLIGTALSRFLTLGGHDVVPLVRGQNWDPQTERIDSMEGVDIFVHLAGEPIADHRWSAEQRQRILQSRERSTRLLARAIAAMQRKPSAFVSASAVGYYGDKGDAWLDEDASHGDGFAAEVCKRWEDAAQGAGVRTVNLRIGLVMSPMGGPLPQMLTPAKLGALGPFGAGKQYMSWIGIDDIVGALHRAMFDDALSGPVNGTAPHPLTNKELVRTVGRVVRRPAFIPIPELAMKTLFGAQKATELFFFSQRVRPTKLQAAGFTFLHTELEPCLRHLLGK